MHSITCFNFVVTVITKGGPKNIHEVDFFLFVLKKVLLSKLLARLLARKKFLHMERLRSMANMQLRLTV